MFITYPFLRYESVFLVYFLKKLQKLMNNINSMKNY